MKKENSSTHTALYRKYRSRTLDEVVGQKQVTEILKRSLKRNKIAHAYLLTGPRGVGKTSIARILAHEINKLPYTGEATHLDIIEIDAASNNGVDDVRDLREKVQLAPTSADKKVYIIDEVHMLSKPAFNALLKTLEEPPAHIVFILATTDLHKVPATIISRTQHFAFHTISTADLVAHLKKIAAAEKILIDDDALSLIAAHGDGSFRDSISLLDQMSSFADGGEAITRQLVETILGLAPVDAVENLISAVDGRDISSIIGLLNRLEQEGVPSTVLAGQLISVVRQKLAEQPQYVTLLDELLAVAGSSQPQLKLLTVLVGATKPAPGQRVSAAVATKAPSLVIDATPAAIDIPAKKPNVEQNHHEILKAAKAKKSTHSSKNQINWEKLLEYTREHYVALFSVLSKCSHDFNNGVLTLYAGRKFNKTKLDEPKYQAQLNKSLDAIGSGGVTMNILPTTKPPLDEKLAKVADIMGGGHEVQIDELEA